MKKKDNPRKKEGKQKDIKNEYKIPKPIKDFILPDIQKNLSLQSPLLIPDEKIPSTNPEIISQSTPNFPLDEWENKSEEELNAEIYAEGDPKNKNLYCDSSHSEIEMSLPMNIINIAENDITWQRPSEYVLNYYLDRAIKAKYQKKNYVQFREEVKNGYKERKRKVSRIENEYRESFQENNMKIDGNTSKEKDKDKENPQLVIQPPPLTEEEIEEELVKYYKGDEIGKYYLQKDFFGLIKEYDYKVVNYENRAETEEEYSKRKDIEDLDNKKGKKIVKKPKKKNDILSVDINENDLDKLVFKYMKPSNLSLTEFKNNSLMQNPFYSWLTSIFQMILDLNINDCFTNKSIFTNIYPQKDGIPVYNPEGKYIIKLYQMGKPRKIIIDDRIPCNRDNEYFLPQCQNIEEIWPALFTKALIKLNMYKIKYAKYYKNEQINDVSLIYALTGMHILSLDPSPDILSLFKDEFKIREKNAILNEDDASVKDKNETGKVDKKSKKKKGQDKTSGNDKGNNNIIADDAYINNDFLNSYECNKPKNYYAFYKSNVPNNKNEKRENKNYNEDNYFDILDYYNNKSIANGTLINQIKMYLRNKVIRSKDDQSVFPKNIPKNQIDDYFTQKKHNVVFKKGYVNNKKSSKDVQENNTNKNSTTAFRRKEKRSSTTIQKKGKNKSLYKLEDLIDKNNIISNYLYPVNDFFSNGDFNMKRLKFLDFSDLVKTLTEKKVQFKQLALTEKKKYLLSRRELKKKQLEIKTERLSELCEIGTKYEIFKIINMAFDLPEFNFFNDYNENQINYAKKCILNNWKFPPADYFEEEFKKKEEEKKKQNELKKIKKLKEKKDRGETDKIGKAKLNENIEINKINIINQQGNKEENKENSKNKLFDWTPELYNKFIGNIDQYNVNILEPWTSDHLGTWIRYSDLFSIFNKILIIQNHRMIYHYKLLNECIWDTYKTDILEPLEEFNCFLLLRKNDPLDNINQNENNNGNDKGSMLIIFEPLSEKIQNSDQIKTIVNPYISFDLIDISNQSKHKVIQSNVILNNFYSIYSYSKLDINCEYLIKINGGNFNNGYIFQLMSQHHQINNISFNNYLRDYRKFNEFNFYLPHNIIEKNKNFVLARIAILPANESFNEITNNKIIIKTSLKYDIKFIKRYIKIFLVKNNSSVYKKEIEEEEFFYLYKKDFLDDENKIKINCHPKENDNNSDKKDDLINDSNSNIFYLIISIKSEYTLLDNEFQFDILSNEPAITFKKIQDIEPFEINDSFNINKDGLLFSYYIYPSDKIECSLDISIYKKIKEIQCANKSKNYNANAEYIESNELNNKMHLLLELYQLTKEPCLDFATDAIKFSYSNKGILVNKWDFYNNLFVSHLILNGGVLPIDKKKPAKKDSSVILEEEEKKLFPYLLICYFDMSEVLYSELECIKNDTGFTIRIFSSDNIGFIKDSSKVDHEKIIQEDWENKDCGRKLRASKSRVKFLLLKKMDKERLTDEENIIVNQERERRSTSQIDHIEIEDSKGNKINSTTAANKKPAKLLPIKPINYKDKLKGDSSLFEDECCENNRMFSYLLHTKEFSMKNIFEKKFPQTNKSRSVFIKDYLEYINKNRKIYNRSKDGKTFIYADNKYIDKLKENICNHCAEYDKSYNLNLNSDLINNFDLNENSKNEIVSGTTLNRHNSLQNINQRFFKVRLNNRKKSESLINIRNNINNTFIYKDKIKRRMNEYMDGNNNEKIDINQITSLYKEGKNNLGENEIIVKKFFNYCSGKIEDSIKNDMKKYEKNKDEVVKILEDINYNKWDINGEIVDKLKGMIK